MDKEKQLFKDDINPYKMPSEYKGEYLKGGGYTKFQPRRWTKEEEAWALKLKEKGLTIKQIAQSIDRDVTQVSIKMKRLGKKNMTYNEPHYEEKSATNEEFLNIIKPKSILDVYAGMESFYDKYETYKVVSNDKNKKAKTDYSLDALELVCHMYVQRLKFDMVDLDPFGSAYDCFDLSIKIAQKGLIVTLGEIGHKRFKRLDFVRRYYGIETIEEFTTEAIVEHIIKIGGRNKKLLTPVFVKEWRNISRVYFKIGKLKITEQWKGKNY